MKLSRVARWLHLSGSESPRLMGTPAVQGAMNEVNQSQDSRPDDVLAAFDRERQMAQELNRLHTEHVRSSRADDRQVRIERRRRPR